MISWQWLTTNSITLQGLFAAIGAVLTFVTIVVLVITWRAVKRQAIASEKLTEATERQIATSTEQAKAAREQVEVARRQITESLRPILVARLGGTSEINTGEIVQQVKIKNEGAGVALDVWWTHGKPNHQAYSRRRIDVGILPPGMKCTITVNKRKAIAEGFVIIYRSLSGILSATMVERESNEGANVYYSEVDEDFKNLGDIIPPI